MKIMNNIKRIRELQMLRKASCVVVAALLEQEKKLKAERNDALERIKAIDDELKKYGLLSHVIK